MSTGFGPVGFYTSIGGNRRTAGSTQASYQRQLAAQRRQIAQAEKAALVQQLADAFLRILSLHRVDFPAVQRPRAPEPPAPDRAAIRAHYEKEALAGIGIFKRAERAAARQRAAAAAEAEVARRWQDLQGQQAEWQRQLDNHWRLLCDNDPDTVLGTLAEAFEDNEAPAAAVGLDGGEVSLVLVVPPAGEAIPDQLPSVTAAGNPSVRKISATDRAAYYKAFVFGQALVTLRETFAVAPGLTSARLVVLRNDGRDVYGRPLMPCLAALTVARAALAGIRWDDADAVGIVVAVAPDGLVNEKGRAKDLAPLDLTDEPDIVALIGSVDLEDFAGG